MTIQEALDTALMHHQAGRVAEAEKLYIAVLKDQPNHADARHLLGVLAYQVKRFNIAEDLIRGAIRLNPMSAQYAGNLGLVMAATGRVDEAILQYKQAITLGPNFPELPYNLGNAYYEQRKFDESIAEFKKALALRPDYPEALNNLGNVYFDMGRFEEATTLFERAVQLQPNYPEAHNNMGTVLYEKGQFARAIDCYHKSLSQRLDYADAYNNLGQALFRLGKPESSIAAFTKAISITANFAEAYSNLGNVLKEVGRPDEAVECYKKALSIEPDFKLAYNNLGVAYKDRGELDAALEAYDRALKIDPNYSSAASNRIYTIHYHPAFDTPAICAELAKWNRLYAMPLAGSIQPHKNSRDPDRRLKIGYVSPDFREHVVGWNLLPLLSGHDRKQFEIYCYASVFHPDAMTEKLKANTDAWRNLVGVKNSQAAEMIRRDQIDILIDLSLHSAQNRLLLFAEKPAPVQATYLGYCGSTGLGAIDYRLSDPYLDPPGANQGYSERTICLPRTYWCYQPGGDAEEPNALPASSRGHVTFGCLNNFAKVSEPALSLWAMILSALPGSRLLLQSQPGSHRNRVAGRFVERGISPDRFEFIGKQDFDGYIRTYQKIDIALDPFPYGGGITTCDALWMGVPVINLEGKTAVGRSGKSILSNLDLKELLAQSTEEYLQIAIDLANDSNRLSSLRGGLRERMKSSPLMDAPAFARDVEQVFRQIWRRWCESAKTRNI